jgi:hypothetical protein
MRRDCEVEVARRGDLGTDGVEAAMRIGLTTEMAV